MDFSYQGTLLTGFTDDVAKTKFTSTYDVNGRLQTAKAEHTTGTPTLAVLQQQYYQTYGFAVDGASSSSGTLWNPLLVAEHVAGRAQQGQHRGRQRRDEEQAVAPLGRADTRLGHAKAEARVLQVAEGLFDSEAPTVGLRPSQSPTQSGRCDW
jgi:hypothetical protein